MPQGVQKVSEKIFQPGRAAIITDSTAASAVPTGTLKIFTDTSTNTTKFQFKDIGSNTWSNITPKTLFTPRSITGDLLASRTLTGNEISLLGIKEENLDKWAVTTNKIYPGAVVNSVIAANTIKKDRLDKSFLLDMDYGGNLSQKIGKDGSGKYIVDDRGVYPVTNFYREDGTLYLTSTLSDRNSAKDYLTNTWDFFDATGKKVKTLVYSLTYDYSHKVIDMFIKTRTIY